MSIKNLFTCGDKKKRISHVRNLVSLAYTDGVMSPEEQEIILQIAERSGMTQEELDFVMEKPDEIKFYVPRKTSDRIEEIYDMVTLMMIDGGISDQEMLLCKLVAEKMHFDPVVIDVMIDDIVDMIARDIVFEAGVQKIMDKAGIPSNED